MLDVLYYPVSAVMWFWHQAFGLVLGPASGVAWGLSVVFLVLTLRTLMIKPFLAQGRAGRRLQAIAPQLAELRKRHTGDKQKLLEETQKLQHEHGVNPLGGCLPLLIQLPVFFALLHVLSSFNRPGLSFEQNTAIPNYVFGPDEVRSFLEARLFGAPLSSYLVMPQSLLDSFGAHVQRWEVVAVAVPLILLAAVATHITARFSLRQQQIGQAAPEAGSQAAQIASFMRWTPWIFPLGTIIGGLFFPFPIAIVLYWLANSAWTMAQQHLVYRAMATQTTVQAQARTQSAPRPGQKPAQRPRAKPPSADGSDRRDPGTPRAS
ncbi:MAG: membrane protein insertase YidC [Pseudonocardiaceae bacterium]